MSLRLLYQRLLYQPLVNTREAFMKKPTIRAAGVFGLLTLSAVAITVPAMAQQPTVQRKVLLTQDMTIPGYQAVMVSVEIPAGGREGRHTHPGAVAVYVIEGALALDYEGRPTTGYKAGDTFYIEPGKIHEGINNSSSAVKLIATFVTEKGKPLTSPAP
jgi:quercetin dioxygenase-like cupin family protein